MPHHGHVVIRQIPITTRLSHTGHGAAKHILASDRARARKLLAGIQPQGPIAFHTKSLRKRQPHHTSGHGTTHPAGHGGDKDEASGDSVDVTDAGVTYTMEVGVGTPSTNFNLLIDTGSSNTWVGASKKFHSTSTSKKTGDSFNVSYGSGKVTGSEFNDTVTLGPDLVIQNQGIGVASSAQGFNGVDGILGIGPVDLTQGTTSGNEEIPTVTDNLFKQGTIPTNSIGISYVPTTSAGQVANGELTFGGTDNAKFSGEITYVPITKSSPANKYWGIDQSITYGTSQTLLKTTSGIVDTGTTLLLLATDAFNAYQKATGGVLDQSTGLLTVTEAQFEKLESLFFHIGGTTFELTPNAQIWPRSLNTTLGGEEDKIYLVTADLGSEIGQGLDFIDGFVFLQRFYSVYDTTNSRVGLATTEFTGATTN